jgi:hypothetical protein
LEDTNQKEDPVETRFELPPTVAEPLEVYLNGILQQPGVDFQLAGRTLIFPRVLEPEVKLNKLQWVLVALGVTGSHKKHDSLDVIYEHEGRRLVATGLMPVDQPA